MSITARFVDSLEPRQLFTSLTPGQTVTATIGKVGQVQEYTVSLVAGRNITVAAGDKGTTSFATDLRLINPSGQVVASSSGDTGAFISTTAAVTGTYKVRIGDVGNNQTGSASVTAFYYASSITDSDDAYAAESGRRRAATIGPGDLDVWTLTATAGNFLSVVATENVVGESIDIGVILVGPDGKVVSAKTSSAGVKIDVASSAKGNYYAVVYEPGQNATGRYGISFARAPGAQYAGDPDTINPLQNNVTRNGDLPGGDMDIWSLSLTRGQTISVSILRTTGSLDPELLLIGPDGKVVSSANGSTSASLSYTITTTGTYWILARDREADDGGQYAIKYKV